MKNMRRILCMALAVAMVAIISVGLTIAYLTDRDSKANVFTMGNVDIVLNEEFKQSSMLTPGVDIEKIPTISNTGKNDAWVWAQIAIPTMLDSEYAYNNIVHFNYDKNFVNDAMWTWKTKDNSTWNMTTQTINGMDYNVYTVMYQSPLKVGNTTEPVMTKVYLDHNVDIAPDGQVYIVKNGVTTPVDWNVKEEAFPIIFVSAYAVQVEGFNSVWEAHDAYFAQWDKNGAIWAPAGFPVRNEADLLNAITNGGPYVLEADIVLTGSETIVTADTVLNLNGHTISADRDYVEGAGLTTAEITTLVADGCTLTIKGEGGVINTADTGAYAIAAINGANVVIDGATLEAYHDAAYVRDGKLTIISGFLQSTEDKNGSADGSTDKCVDCHRSTVINCYDTAYTTGEAVVIVKGGTFVNFDPSCVHEGKMHSQNFVAEGYKVVAENQTNGEVWYKVIPE